MNTVARSADRVAAPSLGRRGYLTIFLVALAVRAVLGVWLFTRADDATALQFPDEVQYWQMAESLQHGDGLTDELGFRATRMPLYPALLSAHTSKPAGTISAKTAQWPIGALAAVLTASLAAAMFDRRVGWISGLLVAVDPFLAFFTSLLLTETLFIAALLALFRVSWPVIAGGSSCAGGASGHAVSWGRWYAIGALAALCVYTRVSSVGLVVALGVFIAVVRRFDRRSLLGIILAGTVLFASLLPWAARNSRVTGDWCFLTHRGGISLYDGVGPRATGSSDLGDIKQMPAVRDLSEVEWNRFFLTESFRLIRQDPMRIARLAMVKIARTWNPIPNAESHRSWRLRIVSAVWTIPTFALSAAAVMLWPRWKRGSRRHLILLLLPAAYLTLLHSLFVGSVRYRLGAVPLLDILCAVVLVALVERVMNATRKHNRAQ